MRLDISAKARADLSDARERGLRHWGPDQAASYDHKLKDRMRALARGDLTGAPAGDVAPGHRRLVVGRHVVWFYVKGDLLRIFRVLHQSQDPSHHLR